VSATPADDAEVSDRFASFYAAEYERFVRLAHVLLGGPGDPEALAQETFARLHPRFESLHDPSAYARTTLVNLCHRTRRRDAREMQFREMALGSASSAEDEVRELLDVIDALPFRQRAVVVLRYYDDQSEEAIAEILGCRPGTVKSLAHRALARLRKELSS
jgi:RNA polymerase sigma-70 factor (sigma-E family)